MKDPEETINKLHDLYAGHKQEKLDDYDSFLLKQHFEHVRGDTPLIIYDKWQERLGMVYSRLLSLTIQGKIERPPILDEIDNFRNEEKKLPPATPKAEDWSKGGRMIEIHRGDASVSGSVPPDPEIFKSTFERISEEQYHILKKEVIHLYYKAYAYLPESIVKWHKDEEYVLNAPYGEVKIKNKQKE